MTSTAYIAGIFDAEGCICYYKRHGPRDKNCYYHYVQLVMTNKDVIDIVSKSLEPDAAKQTERKQRPNRKREYQVRWYKQDALLRIAKLLLPFLVVKKEQMELLEEALNTASVERKAEIAAKLTRLKNESLDPTTDEKCAQHLVNQPIDVNYLAGFLDGDGCFHQKSKHPIIRVYQTRPAILYWLRWLFGGTVSLSRKSSEAAQTVWNWTIYSKEKVEPILRSIHSSVIEKKETVSNRLQLCAKTRLQQCQKHTAPHRSEEVKSVS
jgi:hypothetical protein